MNSYQLMLEREAVRMATAKAPTAASNSGPYTPSAQQRRAHKRFQTAQSQAALSGWTTYPRHISDLLRRDLRSLRARSRAEAQNNDYVRKFISLCETNVIGADGISANATVRDARDELRLDRPANLALNAYWNDFVCSYCDMSECLNFVDIQRLFIRQQVTDGEFIAIIHESGATLRLEIMDPEQLDVDLTRPNGQNKIIMGVEFNRSGQRVAYYFNDVDINGHYVKGDYRRVPAARVIHRFMAEYPQQPRGIPWLYTALYRLKMLGGYEDAAITAARAGAENVGYYTTKLGADGEEIGYTEDEAEDVIIEDTEPGSKIKLPPGVDFKSYDPTYPHDQFGPFTERALRGIGAGLLVNYESLSNDRSNVNFTSLRHGELEQREVWKLMQKFAIDGLVRPIRERVLYNGWLGDRIKIGSRPLRREWEDYKPANYRGRRWDWVDPLKEHTANEKAIKSRTTSISQIIRDGGRDPGDVFQEIADEREELRRLNIPLDDALLNGVMETLDDEQESTKAGNA